MGRMGLVRKTTLALMAMASFIIGLAYVGSGLASVINWLSNWFSLRYEVLPAVIPPDPWLSVVLVTIGLVLISSAYYLMRNNTLMTIATLLIGSGLAVAVMAIQVIATLASVVDVAINGELMINQLLSGLIRVDAILGYISTPLFILSSVLFRLMRKEKLLGLTLHLK